MNQDEMTKLLVAPPPFRPQFSDEDLVSKKVRKEHDGALYVAADMLWRCFEDKQAHKVRRAKRYFHELFRAHRLQTAEVKKLRELLDRVARVSWAFPKLQADIKAALAADAGRLATTDESNVIRDALRNSCDVVDEGRLADDAMASGDGGGA